METKTRNSLIVYLVLTFGLSSIFYARDRPGVFFGRRRGKLPALAAGRPMSHVET